MSYKTGVAKSYKWIMFGLICFSIAGCLDEKNEFTINPDGSGKVVYESTISQMNISFMGEESDPKDLSKNNADKILDESSGVDKWEDVSYKQTDDGATYFKGTAYFSDINKLDIYNCQSSFVMKRNNQGEIVIEMKTDDMNIGEDMEEIPNPEDLSEEELDKLVQKTKSEYNQGKMMMAGILSTFKVESILHLPEPIKKSSNFEKIDDRTVRLVISGSKVLQVMDKMMADDDLIKMGILESKVSSNESESDLLMLKELFGEKAPVQVVLSPDAQPRNDNQPNIASRVSEAAPKMSKEDIEDIEDNWNDFLHYAAIGRFELAKTHAELIIESKPDPTQLLDLSEENQEGYRLLLTMNANSDDLREVSGEILKLIDKGRYIRRTDPKIITQEIQRLSKGIRANNAATERLKNSGDFAIPQMLAAIADQDRKNEHSYIIEALPKIGRRAIRPLAAALQMQDTAVKVEVIRALGIIGYYEPLPYLKYLVETTDSEVVRTHATNAIKRIDSSALKVPAAELFFRLGENYYNQDEPLAAAAEFDTANVWFWDTDKRLLVREEVNKEYFDELMTMRVCEWTLKTDTSIGKAIGLWVAAFIRAESTGEAMPKYFGADHLEAMRYAVTAGPEYLHQALERALRDNDAYVALGAIEALEVSVGEKSLIYRTSTEQPLAKALSFADRKVRYSASIAFAEGNPLSDFAESELIVKNLAEAILGKDLDGIGQKTAQEYAMRAVLAMSKLASFRNKVVDLSAALPELVEVTQKSDPQMRIHASHVLAYLSIPDAQQAIAAMAMDEQNDDDVRETAFESLAISAKINGNLLLTDQVDAIYGLISSSTGVNKNLRESAAEAYGALNLPIEQVKKLILDQSKS